MGRGVIVDRPSFRKDGGVRAHLRAPLNAGMSTDGREPALVPADEAAAESKVDDRAYGVFTALVLRDAHRPYENAGSRGPHQARELIHIPPGCTRETFEVVPRLVL